MKKTLLVSVLFLFVFCGVAFSQYVESYWTVKCSVLAMSDGYHTYPFNYEERVSVTLYVGENYWELYTFTGSGEMWGNLATARFNYWDEWMGYTISGTMKIGKSSAKAKVFVDDGSGVGFGTCKMKLIK